MKTSRFKPIKTYLNTASFTRNFRVKTEMANRKVLAFFICLCSAVGFVLAAGEFDYFDDFSRDPTACPPYVCPRIPVICRGPNQVIGSGGYNNCCLVCVTLLGE